MWDRQVRWKMPQNPSGASDFADETCHPTPKTGGKRSKPVTLGLAIGVVLMAGTLLACKRVTFKKDLEGSGFLTGQLKRGCHRHV